jgi:glutamine amidotransferase
MIRIVDYGMGNVRAFLNVYKSLGIPASAAKVASDLDDVTRLILPGVGSFDHAMELLQQSGMRAPLDTAVASRRVPVLGVCVGMQILAKRSEEGQLPGLNWVEGSVLKLRGENAHSCIRLPHMGWNDVIPSKSSRLFAGLEQGARFYFLHSYHFCCESRDAVLAEADYGRRFACAVQSENVFGVQFHPEKSHQYGAQLLKNFAEL